MGCGDPIDTMLGYPVPTPLPLWTLPLGSLPPAGVFVYPLEESELVDGFEAVVGGRRVTFQVQSRHRVQGCCLACGGSPGRPRRCASGECMGQSTGARGADEISLLLRESWRDAPLPYFCFPE